ncbi:UNVERIFIED_CONTAM: hypothetical protein K2H54_005730 [Gekko kuhli]
MKRKSSARRRKVRSDSNKENELDCLPKQLFTSPEKKKQEGTKIYTPAKRQHFQVGESSSLNQQPEVLFQKCRLVDLVENHGPVHRVLQEHMGMTADDIPPVERQKSRSAMYKLVTAAAYSIINYCANDVSYSKCEGCLLDEPAQLAHECLTWPSAFYEENLKHVCCNLNMGPVLYVITAVGISMNIFSMNQNHIVALANLVEDIRSALKPCEHLRATFQKCHEPYVKLVEKFLHNTFQNRMSLTTFL